MPSVKPFVKFRKSEVIFSSLICIFTYMNMCMYLTAWIFCLKKLKRYPKVLIEALYSQKRAIIGHILYELNHGERKVNSEKVKVNAIFCSTWSCNLGSSGFFHLSSQ